MRRIRVAAAALNQTPLDWIGNRRRIRQALKAARAAEATLVCLPELCITGYGCEDAFLSAHTARKAWSTLHELLPETEGMAVSFGLPVLFHNVVFNCAALAVDGRLAGLVAKRNLAGDGIHYEPRWFKAWPTGQVMTLRTEEGDCPIGDVHFDVGGVRVGFEICEDAWVANRPGGALSQRGIDVILNPSASHFAFGKWLIRERFVLEGARAFGVTYVYANLLGNEAGRAIYDGGTLIASGSEVVARGRRFDYGDVTLATAVVDVDHTRQLQAKTVSLKPNLTADDAVDRVPATFNWPPQAPTHGDADLEPWAIGHRSDPEQIKCEEFTRAEALALFDYLRKSRSRGFVVSLSGGADSAACAVLVAVMIRLALRDYGVEGLRARLGYIHGVKTTLEGVPELEDRIGAEAEALAHALTGVLLTTVYQATRNSGEVTRLAAEAVAEAVGATHHHLDVDPLVELYRDRAEGALGRKLTWETDDLALQNIQARVRAPSVWMLANVKGALLLSTSNRSEAAVGYATMDGDTAGGLSPIAGIDKAFLRFWLRWMESEGPHALRAFPALHHINAQAPTAELRPQDQGQTDETDLMPYDLLDAIERAAIRDKLSPLEVFELMQVRFDQYGARQLLVWVERFFRLWCRNQWKRERYAPSFHLDDENLDPRTWCRFPILSGGFEEELIELRAHVERQLASL